MFGVKLYKFEGMITYIIIIIIILTKKSETIRNWQRMVVYRFSHMLCSAGGLIIILNNNVLMNINDLILLT